MDNQSLDRQVAASGSGLHDSRELARHPSLTKRHRILRDFLPEDVWSQTASGFERLVLHPLHSSGLQHVYAHGDGISYHSADTIIDRPLGESAVDVDGLAPSLRAFASHLAENEHVSGFLQSLGEWTSFTLRAYLYPSGTGLTWHTDRKCLAAYVYYAHATWDPAWGGELLISDGLDGQAGCQTRVDEKLFPSHPGISAGSGSFFLPLPNSLVLIQGGTPHSVKRVEPAAGNRARASISGFFYQD